ncbi:TPA: hypothetical protein ACPY7G_003640 [Morganella morganii]|uniref:hypothetical protein n=1 Tax=Morganella morganii TaxID=582 RepID=UPI00195AE52A|nr:hypothetical protein [Morganella morganii]MBM7214413.1 hypothetical protein [Morganella morganii]MBN4017038.1 hypothetical protein [Morganella morganii]QSB61370.1 hypothetical protein JW291_13610 [Morganella morganii]QSB89269.1 hypothetical protein JW297_12230 [Morganella morganii]
MAKGKKDRKRIIIPDENVGKIKLGPESSGNSDLKHPKFSFCYLQRSHCISNCQKDEKVGFADKLCRISQLSWRQIKAENRHGLGFEKISRRAIKAGIPSHITEDVDHFLAFRFDGMKPMVGYRLGSTFFVVWVDRDFTLYDHG